MAGSKECWACQQDPDLAYPGQHQHRLGVSKLPDCRLSGAKTTRKLNQVGSRGGIVAMRGFRNIDKNIACL